MATQKNTALKPTVSHWKSSQLMNNHSFEVNFYSDKDFKTVSTHSHDFFELYFFIQGKATYIIENGRYRLQDNDILLISPSNLHRLDINDASETYERIVLWLNPRFIKKLSTPKTDLTKCFSIALENKNHLIRNAELSAAVKDNLMQLQNSSKSLSFGDDIISEMLVSNILLNIANYCLSPTTVADARLELLKNTERNNTVSNAIDYITKHISDNISLDILAEKAFVSKYHLTRIFKAETGTTPYQYILKKRLILSKQLIENGLPITEVYLRSGFNDYSNYFREFKNEYGITPKQYYCLTLPSK